MKINLAGRTLRALDISPDLARMWLEGTTTANRRISWTVVDTYVRLMKAGKWRPAGDPIRRDSAGNVLDGQKRLWAIVKSGTTQTLIVLEGATLEDQDVFDAGQGRRPAQQLAMRGNWKNAPQVAAIVRLVVQWHTGTLIGNSYRPSTMEVVEFADRYRDRLQESVNHGLAVGRQTALSKSIVGAFAFMAFDHATDHPEKFSTDKVREYLELLASGANLGQYNPILVLRNQAQRYRQKKISEGEPAELYRIIATWEAWRKGREYSKLQISLPITADKLTL